MTIRPGVAAPGAAPRAESALTCRMLPPVTRTGPVNVFAPSSSTVPPPRTVSAEPAAASEMLL